MKEKESGFTLLELIIVLLLSTLILGLVTVYFAHTLSSANLQATVRDFSTTLRQARYLAKINGEPQTVTIDPASKEYGIEGKKTRKIPANLELKIIDLSAGEIPEGPYHLVFEPNGAVEGAEFQISDKKKTVGISLDPLVGTVVRK